MTNTQQPRIGEDASIRELTEEELERVSGGEMATAPTSTAQLMQMMQQLLQTLNGKTTR